MCCEAKCSKTNHQTALLPGLGAVQTLPSGPAVSVGTWFVWEELKATSPILPQVPSAAGKQPMAIVKVNLIKVNIKILLNRHTECAPPAQC